VDQWERIQENEPAPGPPADEENPGEESLLGEEEVSAPLASDSEHEDDLEEEGGGEEGKAEAGEEEEEEPLGAEAEEEVVDPCTRRLRIRVTAERIQKKFDKTYADLRKSVHIRGFRRGKVPRRYLERQFGTEIEKELREELVQRSFREVLEGRDMPALGMPEFKDIQLKAGEPFQYVVEIDVFPTFEPPTYEGLAVPRDEVRVSDEEVETDLAQLRESSASLVPPPEGDESILPSDRLVVNYRLFDGERERFHRKRIQVIPEVNAVDGIAVEGLAEGLKDRGAPKRFKAKPPLNFRDGHLAGREIEMEIEVADVRRVHIPDLEGELPQNFGCQGLPELRDHVRAAASARKRRELDRKLEDRIVDILAAKADVPLPEKIVLEEARRATATAGPGAAGEPDPGVLAKVREEMKRRFLLIAIARKEGIEVADDEVKARIGEWEAELNRPAGTLVKGMEKTADYERIREAILLERTRERLRRLNEAIGGEEAAPSAEGAAPPEAMEAAPAPPESPAAETGGAPEGAGGQA